MNDMATAFARYQRALDELNTARTHLRTLIALESSATCGATFAVGEAPQHIRPSVLLVQRLVSERWGFDIHGMWSKSKAEPLRTARMQAMSILRRLTPLSTSELGRAFRRDHATVLNAVKGVQARCDTDASYRTQYEALLSKCQSQLESNAA